MGSKRRRSTTRVSPRPLAPQPDVRSIIREELTKALSLPAGASATQLTAGYLQAMAQRNMMARASGDAALARDPYNDTSFGPGEPLYPAPIDPVLPTGRPAPRRWEYPVSTNLQIATTRTTPWTVLRDAADRVSIMRACIEVRKSTITGLEWNFGVDSARARHLAKRTGASDQQIAQDLGDKYADDMDRLRTWWSVPDRINNWSFSEWMGALLEDQLVLDAVSLYPHLSLGGDLHSLELLDSSTIKPLLDRRGATPQPPLAAYQQILWGFPRGEYAQSPATEVDAEFTSAIYGHVRGPSAPTDSLIYKVRTRRSNSPYGFSCVEQALADVDLWLRRFDWLRSEYQAGVTPEMIVQVEANMTPEQLRQYEAVFNDELSGQTAERHRARFLPSGFHPSYPQIMDSKFSSDLDLHIVRLICAAFDVLPTSLGFTPNHGMGGMAGGGHVAQEQDTQLYRASKPTARWLTDLINEVSRHYLGMPPEVTFQFQGLDPEDEEKEATLLTGYVSSGLTTLNEGRDQLNLPRYDFPEANQPLLVTPTGPAWLNVESSPVGMPGNLPSAPQNQPGYSPGPAERPALPPRDEQVQDTPERDTDNAERDRAGATAGSARKAEQDKFFKSVRSYARVAERRPWEPFTFIAHSPEVAKAANELVAAGEFDAACEVFELAEAG